MGVELIMILLWGIAVLLMAVEILIVPGFGIAGILSAACVVAAEVLMFMLYGGWGAFGGLLLFFLLAFVLLRWLGKSKALDKLSLHSTIDSSNATQAQLSVKVGEEGVALTRLALIGNAEFSGRVVEVKSSGKFIDEGTPVVVVGVNEALILVREK